MVAKLSTTINKIQSLPNFSNSKIINEFLIYMKGNSSLERHQNNNLNVMIEFSNYFDSNITFYDINKKEQILSFLDTKIKNSEDDPDKRWITTWNDYLVRIKYFFRWMYNCKDKDLDDVPFSDWETPDFVKIKNYVKVICTMENGKMMNVQTFQMDMIQHGMVLEMNVIVMTIRENILTFVM